MLLLWCCPAVHPQFQDEANTCCAETVAALKAAWAADQSIPVVCINTSTGTRAEGSFKIIDGKKRIVFHGPTTYAAEGTIMDPVEFEKAAERGTTRNWQLSIAVAGAQERLGLSSSGCLLQCGSSRAVEHARRLRFGTIMVLTSEVSGIVCTVQGVCRMFVTSCTHPPA